MVGLFYYSLFADQIILYDDDEGKRKTAKSWNAHVNDPGLLYSGKMDSVLRYSIIVLIFFYRAINCILNYQIINYHVLLYHRDYMKYLTIMFTI